LSDNPSFGAPLCPATNRPCPHPQFCLLLLPVKLPAVAIQLRRRRCAEVERAEGG
jgi:hypothetical protein